MTGIQPRQCYAALEGECDETGYWPVLVTENAAGYAPLKGNPAEFRTPWYWGKTLAECQEQCAKVNAEVYGLSAGDATAIVLSSMKASGAFGRS